MITIDGINILERWGMRMDKTSAGALFQYPSRREVRYTNYAEVDGIHPDLRKFEAIPRNIALLFLMKHNGLSDLRVKYDDFMSVITSAGIRIFKYDLLELPIKLRYFSTTNMSIVSAKGSMIKINFMEDNFTVKNVSSPQPDGWQISGQCRINGVDVSQYGVFLENPIDGVAVSAHPLKPCFTDGRDVFTDDPRKAHREIAVNFLMASKNKTSFTHNYRAFFHLISRENAMKLYFKEKGIEMDAYYKSCGSFEFERGVRPFAKFRLSFVLINE